MSPYKDRYLATLVSGYALMSLQILLALASVPLALSYLGKEGFGIWSLATQVSVWLLLLDGGMNGALSRNLIDYHREPDQTNLRHCIATGFRILITQGLLVMTMTIVLGLFAGPIFGLNANDSESFRGVMTLLGTATCVGFTSKIIQSWLYATQRLDVCNLIALVTISTEFGLLWFLLKTGHGLPSLAWARLFQAILTGILICWSGIAIAKFPISMLLGPLNFPMMKLLATFGGGMFALSLGSQLLMFTQTAMVTKHLGLATAAVWAAAPKLFQVTLQMVSKLWDYRLPHLSSLMAGNHTTRLIKNFDSLFRMTAYIGGGGIGAAIALNPTFLFVWTKGTIHWDQANDNLLGIAFYFSLLIRCLTDFVLHTKKIGWMPILMLLEGVIFVASSMWLLPRYGIPGMLLASLVAGGTLRLPYAWKNFSNYLLISKKDSRSLVNHTIGGAFLGILIYTLLSLLQWLLSDQSSLFTLACQGLLTVSILAPISLKLILVGHRQHLPA
jgi:O-antigen/teichoic acid export membrane protein